MPLFPDVHGNVVKLGLHPSLHVSMPLHRPPFPKWTGRKPTATCICALPQPRCACISADKVFQAKLLDSGNVDARKDLHTETDFMFMATKRSTQAIGRSMGFMMFFSPAPMVNPSCP
ncbi:hypothetical protein F2P79_015453 [Pimephales promelas]|nr:hypothetical protein F2P79_015453 [Pimephales promelas]